MHSSSAVTSPEKRLSSLKRTVEGNYQADFLGEHETAKGEEQFVTLIRRIIDRGYYYRIMEASEIERVMQDKAEMQRMMLEEMVKRIEIWLDLGEETLRRDEQAGLPVGG